MIVILVFILFISLVVDVFITIHYNGLKEDIAYIKLFIEHDKKIWEAMHELLHSAYGKDKK